MIFYITTDKYLVWETLLRTILTFNDGILALTRYLLRGAIKFEVNYPYLSVLHNINGAS